MSQGQNDVQVYDPVSDTWIWSATGDIPPLPTGRSGLGGKAAFLGGEFYVVGGEYFPGQEASVLPLVSCVS